MPFQYRLQKFLEIRIRKKEEQLEVVQKCQKEVMRIEGLIEANNQNIKDTRINTVSYTHLTLPTIGG